MLQINELVQDGLVSAIIHGVSAPIVDQYAEGYQDHADGKAFHEHKYDNASPEALSWRIGWNDRALQEPR